MAFLRTLLWIAITVIVVVFSLRNWFPVTINLFGDVQADVKLPVLLLIGFLIGFVPLYVWHRIVRWQMTRRLVAAEQPVSAPAIVTPPPTASATVEPAQAD